MEFTKEEREAVIELAAEKLADRIENDIHQVYGKRLSDIVAMPVDLVARLNALSPQHTRNVFPVIDFGNRYGRIQIGDMIAIAEERKS